MILSIENIHDICKYLSPGDLLRVALCSNDFADISRYHINNSKSILKTYYQLTKDLLLLKNDPKSEKFKFFIDLILDIPKGKLINTNDWRYINISSPRSVESSITVYEYSIIIQKSSISIFDRFARTTVFFDLRVPNHPVISTNTLNFFTQLADTDIGFLIWRIGNHIKGYQIYNAFDQIVLQRWRNDKKVWTKIINHPNFLKVENIGIDCINTFDNKCVLLYDYITMNNAFILDVKKCKIYYFDFLPFVDELYYSPQVWAQTKNPFWLKFERSINNPRKFFIVTPKLIFDLLINDTNEEWGECVLFKVLHWTPIDNFYEFCPCVEDVVSLDKLVDSFMNP